MTNVSFLNKALLAIFHPIDCFDIIKRERGKFKPFPVAVLYLVAVLVNYLYIFIVHFPLSEKKTTDANIALELEPTLIKKMEKDIYFATILGKLKIKEEKNVKTKLNKEEKNLINYLDKTYGVVQNLTSNREPKEQNIIQKERE